MPFGRSWGIVGLGVVIAGLIGLLALGLANKSPVTGKSGYTRVGKAAPDFAIPLLEGGEFVLSEHAGRPVVINFWASWCPPCVEEAPVLERSWQSHKDLGVAFLGIDIQDTEEDARFFVRRFGATYPNGRDEDGKITIDYGVAGLPVTFFVGKDGIVQRRWVGAIKQSELTTRVEEILAGVNPSGRVEGENPEGYFNLEQER
jgi:cytochrome c biogenesis protein CcmG/thiol:disulfide interchange protein DsbE